jgi:hypothetical protein
MLRVVFSLAGVANGKPINEFCAFCGTQSFDTLLCEKRLESHDLLLMNCSLG